MGTGMMTSSIFRLTRWALALAAALEGTAMLVYPGGTPLRSATRGYSFFQNSFSDLGSTVAWNGQANPGSLIHVAASLILVVAGSASFVALIRVYASPPMTRRLARAGGAIALFAAAGLVGAALTPPDLYGAFHRQFTLLAVSAFPLATALLALATALSPGVRRRVPASWFLLTSIVVVWTSLMLTAHPTTDLGWAIPVTLQKISVVTLVATLVFQGWEAEHAAAGVDAAR
jgi:hypothetical protein